MKAYNKFTLSLPVVFMAVLLLCSTSRSAHAETTDSSSDIRVEDKADGQKLWSQNCSRCHNMRSPDQFSDREWKTIVQHMRTRGNLTGVEAREIIEFIKTAN